VSDSPEARRDLIENVYRRLYLSYVESILSKEVLEKVEARIVEGDIESAIDILDDHLDEFANVVPQIVQDAATREYGALALLIGAALLLDITSVQLIRLMRDGRADFRARVAEAQRQALRQSYTEGILRDISLTRSVVDGFGLAPRQQQAVTNYRDMLNRQNATGKPNERRSDAEINRMVRSYRNRLVDVRAEQIARTSATRVASQVQDLALEAAVQEGVLDPNKTVRVWNRISDDRVRDHHDVMEGQTSPLGGVFVDGKGNKLRYPGDPSAPIDTVANCRCTLTIRSG
jgi:hypothetical protein